MVSLLSTKFHEILFSSFRGIALTNCVMNRWTGQKQYVFPPSGGDIIKLLTGFCQNWALLPLIQSFYTLYFRGYIISFKYMPVKLFLVAEVLII